MKHRSRIALFGLAASITVAVPCRAQSVEAGVALYEAEKFVEARSALLPFGDRDAVAAYHLGLIMMEQKDDRKAVEWFERAVKLNPRSAVYYDWLGRAYGRQALTANKLKLPFLARKTKGAWETALALDPDNLDVRDDLIAYYTQAPGFLGGSKQKAREMAQEIKKRDAYRGSISMANFCSGEKDDACVEREFNELVAKFPDSSGVHVSLAALYANQKKFDKSFSVLDQRVRVKPDEPAILYQIGRTASLSGQQLDRGEEALKKYIASPPEKGPSPANAHYRLGLVYEKKGLKNEARREYQTALQLNPKHEEATKALRELSR